MRFRNTLALARLLAETLSTNQVGAILNPGKLSPAGTNENVKLWRWKFQTITRPGCSRCVDELCASNPYGQDGTRFHVGRRRVVSRSMEPITSVLRTDPSCRT
jgi:hypothetical protein